LCTLESKIILPWIAERGEWVAITYHKWIEATPKDDESYGGPYVPDEYCLRKIRDVYHSDLPLERILKSGPDMLSKVTQ
jgi:hypothetical protein